MLTRHETSLASRLQEYGFAHDPLASRRWLMRRSTMPETRNVLDHLFPTPVARGSRRAA